MLLPQEPSDRTRDGWGLWGLGHEWGLSFLGSGLRMGAEPFGVWIMDGD